MSAVSIQLDGGLLLFDVYVQPRSSRTELKGVRGNRVRVRLCAPPVDGAANAALLAFVANSLGVSPKNVILVRGTSGRSKTIGVAGLSMDQLRRWLESAALPAGAT